MLKHFSVGCLLAWVLISYSSKMALGQASNQQPPKKSQVVVWQVLQPHNGGFQVDLPGEPVERVGQVSTQPNQMVAVQMYLASLDQEKATFSIAYHDLTAIPPDQSSIERVLDASVQGSVVDIDGQLQSQNALKVDGYSARQIMYKDRRTDADIVGISRIILVGQRVYQMTVLHHGDVQIDQQWIDRFFGSFEIKD